MLERKVLFFTVCLFVSVHVVRSGCEEPSHVEEIKLELQSMIKDNYINYMSFFNIKSNLEKVKGQLNQTFNAIDATAHHGSYKRKVYVTRLYGESKCKKKRQFMSRLNNTTGEMSSCPWYYVLEVDNDRIPVTIVKAKCSCSNCLVPTRYGYKRDRDGSGGYCKEVNYHMPVTRRDCVGGVYRYRIAIENIPVGCTCQRCSRKKKRGNRI